MIPMAMMFPYPLLGAGRACAWGFDVKKVKHFLLMMEPNPKSRIFHFQLSYRLNSLKGGYLGDYIREHYRGC